MSQTSATFVVLTNFYVRGAAETSALFFLKPDVYVQGLGAAHIDFAQTHRPLVAFSGQGGGQVFDKVLLNVYAVGASGVHLAVENRIVVGSNVGVLPVPRLIVTVGVVKFECAPTPTVVVEHPCRIGLPGLVPLEDGGWVLIKPPGGSCA